MKTLLLEFLTCLFDTYPEEKKAAIQAYLDKPTPEAWEEIYSLIINGKGKPATVWQAVLAVDPTYQQRAETFADAGLKRWHRIPTPTVLIKALQQAVFKPGNN